MTTQAEAALQALESWSRNDYERRQALRIPLSEPEKHEDWCDSVTKMLTSLPPKPAPCNCKRAEPKQAKWDVIPDEFNKWWNGDLDDSTNPYRKDSPIYWAWEGWKAAMKQRKPLTDEEIWREYQGLWPFHPASEPKLAADIAAFARVIERAHGIGGEA